VRALLARDTPLRRGLEAAGSFLLAFLLANATVFGAYSPFAIGFVASAGAGLNGAAALLGAVLGYVVNFGFSGGIAYAGTVIVLFFVLYILKNADLTRSRLFPAVAASVVTCAIGAVQLFTAPASLAGAVYFVSEIVLAGGCAYFYGLARERTDGEEERDLRHTVSLLILLATVLLPLGRVTLLADVALGRLIAVLAVMTAAYYGGPGPGAATGTALGMALDISSMGAPFFTMAYAFSGLVGGVFHRQGRLGVLVAYILADAVAVLWMWEYTLRTTVLFEVFIASVVFAVLPGRALAAVGEFAVSREASEAGIKPARAARDRVERLAKVFSDLQDVLRRTGVRREDNAGDIAAVYDGAAEKVCKKCPLMYHCWQKDYQSTLTALNDVSQVLEERGAVSEADFPTYFSARCVNFPQLTAAINGEFERLLRRRQLRARTAESREIVLQQYGDISAALSLAARDMEDSLAADELARRRLRRLLREREVPARVEAARDRQGRLHASIRGEDLENLLTGDLRSTLSRALRVPLAEPEVVKTPVEQKILLTQAEPLAALAATSARKCSGQSVSGDSGVYFKNDEGKLYMLLSDGMGNGDDAHRESEFVVQLLEKLLRSGMTPDYALKTLNTTVLLRGDVLISTVDMLCVDLFTGETELFKYGAAPTYIRRGKQVERFEGHSLAVGCDIEPMMAPEVARLRLEKGDVAVMLSDGVSDGTADEWLTAVLESYTGESPAELSRLILESCGDVEAPRDDLTVLCVLLAERE